MSGHTEPESPSARPGRVTAATPPPDAHATPRARFDALFRDHQRAVLAYAIRRTPTLADAEDAAAETFIIAWRKIALAPSDEALPWLYAIARRVLANQRRGRGRRERLAALLRVEDVPTPMRLGEAADGPAFRALATLTAADQEVLRLVAWEGLGNQQIAAVLGVSANAVGIRLHRARARFEAALAKIDRDPDDDLKHLDPGRTSAQVKGTNGAAWKGVVK